MKTAPKDSSLKEGKLQGFELSILPISLLIPQISSPSIRDCATVSMRTAHSQQRHSLVDLKQKEQNMNTRNPFPNVERQREIEMLTTELQYVICTQHEDDHDIRVISF